MIMWHCNAVKEVERATAEIKAERHRFDSAWKVYEKKLRKVALRGKLSKDWVPQAERETGQEFYLNLKTGNTQVTHIPHLLYSVL